MRRGAALVLLEVLLIGLLPLSCSGLGLRTRGSEDSVDDADDEPQPQERTAEPRDDTWAPTNASAWERAAGCDSCRAPARIAVAYRGDYHRKALLSHGGGPTSAYGCSDFFHNAQSHWRQIVKPLEAEGSSVKTYFHSYRDAACPQRDERLVRELAPARHEFSDGHLPLIVDSYIKVLQLVLQDEQDIDAVVLSRFDLRYRSPITSLNVQWNVTNVAHREGEKSWATQRKLSDLFFVIPIGHVRPLIHALKESGTHPVAHKATGAGHWFWHPFVNRMGKDALHIIDEQCAPSTYSPSETKTFLGISRGCSEDFDKCPA